MKILGLLLLVAFCSLFYAFFIEPASLAVRHLSVSADVSRPLVFAVLSDPHARTTGPQRKLIKKAVDAVISEKPDFVLLPGDFLAHGLGGAPASAEKIARTLAPLSRLPFGAFAVLGNHDAYSSSDSSAVRSELSKSGIKVLDNEFSRVADTLYLAGLSDFSSGKPDAFRFYEIPDAQPFIVMSHDPFAHAFVPSSTILAVYGHTHGGQVRLPFFGAPLATLRPERGNLDSGYFTYEGAPKLVSAGLGTSELPLRFLSPPEIWIVKLIPRQRQ